MKHLFLLTSLSLISLTAFSQQGTIELPATGQLTSYHTGDDGDLQNGVHWPTQRFTNHGNGTCTDALTGLIWATEGNIMAMRDPDFDQDYDVGDGSVNWTTALDYVAKLNNENYLGHDDWRLPNIMELTSLLDLGRPDTALGENHPFVNIQQVYWSSSSGDDKGIAFAVGMYQWEIHSNSKFWPGQVLWFRKILPEIYADKRKVYVLPVRGEHGIGLIELPKTSQELSLYPGDDKDLDLGVSWPTPRFIDHNDSTVTDRLTGLMWTQNSDPLDLFGLTGTNWDDEITWTQAFAYLDSLNNMNYCGYNDWRLPNRHEILSLRHFGGNYLFTYLPPNNPFTPPAGRYWTSTTAAHATLSVHAVNITLVDVTLELLKEDPGLSRIWPVRHDDDPLPSGSIQGKVLINGGPLQDVLLKIEGPVNATVKTSETGEYFFDYMPPGNYIVTPEKIYYEFSPVSATINLSGQTITQDFTATMTATHGWQNITNHTSEYLSIHDLHFIGQEGWLAGGNDRVYYTPDGGETFQIQALPENSGITSSIFMKNNLEGYVVTFSGKIVKTENGGTNWSMLHEPGGVLNSVHFPPDSDTGYTCGANGTVWSFDDAGITDISPTGVSVNLQSICFPEDNSEGKVLGEVYIGKYKENTWNNLQFYSSTDGRNSLFFNDNITGWAVGGYGLINYTIDGIEWLHSQQSGLSDKLLQDVFFINSTEGWIVGGEVIWHSQDGGHNWFDDAPGFADGMSLVSVFFTSQNEGYAGGNKVLLKYGPLVPNAGVFEKNPATGADVLLYPNPTRGKFQITNSKHQTNSKFKIQNSKLQVEVVDLYGKPVAISPFHQLGEGPGVGAGTLELNISHLPAGIYFVRINLENQTIVKKIIKQ
jgi:photosystem II stability/assembly factor-like uncharacterized protein